MVRTKQKARRFRGSKGKGTRYKKGHSSDSNPTAHSHRDQAKNRFFNVQSGPSQLTVEALAKHDRSDKNDQDMDTVSDSHSEGGQTFQTWASNWTECTNATFGKVHQFWNSSSALHKEILAVLAAVTEVIKSQGGEETETSYFAALMTTLESVEEEMSVAATTYLLSLAIKRVPASVLKSRFAEVSKTLMTILAAHTETETPSLLRHLLMCLAHLLRVQDPSVWTYSSTTQLYNGLLSFTIHPKPKVRKSAQQAVRIVLKASTFMLAQENVPDHHPAAGITAKYCVQQIESRGGTEESTTTLYVLGLLQHVMAVFPLKSMKLTCETILKVMTLANVIVNSTAFKTLHAMFLAEPKETSLSAELNAQLITALYDYQPSDNDVQQMAAWLAVMERAHIHLFRLSPELCMSHVTKLFCVCIKCLQNNNSTVCRMAAKTAKTLLKECVENSVDYLKQSLDKTGQNSAVYKMFSAAEAGLGYQYHLSWDHVLQILTTFFEVAGRECSSIMKKCLLSMADLRDSHRFAYQHDLDKAVGMAVRRMGPSHVLDAIPLQITGDNDNLEFPRSWLLPVMRDNIRDTELAFFASYFLPLASKLRTKAVEHANNKEEVQAKTYDALQLQMWSLLPGFCTNPTDFTQSFKDIAKYLGMALSDRPDLQQYVMTSLRKLLRQSESNDEMKAELGRFAKNYLPILFNLFCQDPQDKKDQKRLAFLDTAGAYLPVTDTQLVHSYFDRCHSKLEEADTTGPKQYAYLDLIRRMVPFIDSSSLQRLYKWLWSKLKTTDQTLQKKSYKALEEICSCKSDATRSFIQHSVNDIQQHLVTSLSTTCPAAKAPRLGCLIHILRHLDVEQKEFLVAVIPEAVACIKGSADRARKNAYDLVTEMAHTMVRWAGGDTPAAVEEYLNLVLAGMDGSAQVVSCVVLAVTQIVFVFRDSLNKKTRDDVIEHVCTLLKSKAREIVEPCFGLLKVILLKYEDADIAAHLQSIVSSLVTMETENRHHFRFKTKAAYQKLVIKFGYQVIADMVPDELQQKQLKNIRRLLERWKRKKQQREKMEQADQVPDDVTSVSMPKVESIDELLRDSDSEDEIGQSTAQKGKKDATGPKKRKQAWLREGGDGDIVDFLDPSVSSKVLASKPETEESRKNIKHDFKTAADGRLIITEDSDEEGDNRGSKRKAPKRKLADDSDDDDLDDLIEAISGQHLKNKKKRVSTDWLEEDEADDMETTAPGTSGYKPGGHGIHRSLEQAEQTTTAKRPGDEYKSKKAGGDVKHKDKPDPYAYIPMDMKMLNRRKKAKAAGQFKNLVKGAKKGAKKGKKQRNKAKNSNVAHSSGAHSNVACSNAKTFGNFMN